MNFPVQKGYENPCEAQPTLKETDIKVVVIHDKIEYNKKLLHTEHLNRKY